MSNSRILSKIPSNLANNVGKILSVNPSEEISPETNYAWIQANGAFEKANTRIFPFFNSQGYANNIILVDNTYLPFQDTNGNTSNILLIVG